MNRKKKGVREFSQIYIIITMKDKVRVPVFYSIMKGKKIMNCIKGKVYRQWINVKNIRSYQ